MKSMSDLAAERRRAGVRQVDVARLLGMSRVQLWSLESSDDVKPTREFVARYMDAVRTAAEGVAG